MPIFIPLRDSHSADTVLTELTFSVFSRPFSILCRWRPDSKMSSLKERRVMDENQSKSTTNRENMEKNSVVVKGIKQISRTRMDAEY